MITGKGLHSVDTSVLPQEALRHLQAQEPALEAYVDELNTGCVVVPALALTKYLACHVCTTPQAPAGPAIDQ